MINYIIGKITLIKASSVVIEANSIGYEVKTGASVGYETGSTIKIFIYLNVRAEALELYGFKTSNEKELFLKLISVKGIGPKSAIAIVASGKLEGLVKAIQDQNAKYLQTFPGVGLKASQQIILDLHGKINFGSEDDIKDPKLNDVSEALKSLGYLSSEIKSVTDILMENSKLSVSELLKLALKSLSK